MKHFKNQTKNNKTKQETQHNNQIVLEYVCPYAENYRH